MEYKVAMNEFSLRLALLDEVKQLASLNNVSASVVVKKLQPYISVNYYRDKSVKRVRIDFTESASMLHIFANVTYPQSK